MKVKTKRKICLHVGMWSLLVILGTFGGLEREYINMTQWLWISGVCLFVTAAAWWKGGYLR